MLMAGLSVGAVTGCGARTDLGGPGDGDDRQVRAEELARLGARRLVAGDERHGDDQGVEGRLVVRARAT